MISIVDVRPEMRAQLPAITHVNGSARLQTVSVEDNPDFHALLVAVGEATGSQMVLNTSFNVKGQPIVNLPEEAIETFLGTGIEFLFLENFLCHSIWGLKRGRKTLSTRHRRRGLLRHSSSGRLRAGLRRQH